MIFVGLAALIIFMIQVKRDEGKIISPRIAALLQLMDYIVSYAIAFLFAQALPQSTNKLLRAP